MIGTTPALRAHGEGEVIGVEGSIKPREEELSCSIATEDEIRIPSHSSERIREIAKRVAGDNPPLVAWVGGMLGTEDKKCENFGRDQIEKFATKELLNHNYFGTKSRDCVGAESIEGSKRDAIQLSQNFTIDGLNFSFKKGSQSYSCKSIDGGITRHFDEAYGFSLHEPHLWASNIAKIPQENFECLCQGKVCSLSRALDGVLHLYRSDDTAKNLLLMQRRLAEEITPSAATQEPAAQERRLADYLSRYRRCMTSDSRSIDSLVHRTRGELTESFKRQRVPASSGEASARQ